MSKAPAGDEAVAHVKAFLWLAGLVGAVSTVGGFLAGDGGEILFAVGVIGGIAILVFLFAGRLIFGDKFYSGGGNDPLLALGSVAVGTAAYFLFPWPTDPSSRDQLKIAGVVVLVMAFLQGVYLYREWDRRRKPATKSCPDCANSVLEAANVCQFCGFRFYPTS